MNILVAVNDAYVHPLAVMLASLLENNQQHNVSVYLLYSDICELNIRKINRLIHKYNTEFFPIKIESNFLSQVPINGFAKETYYRLFAYRFLPEELDRVLFLDPDMVVDGDIGEMYFTEMKDDVMYCAVEDTSNGIEETKRRLRIPLQRPYYNSGTMLMNLNVIRKQFDQERVLDYAEKFQTMLYYCDQDLLNVFYGEKIKALDKYYNYEARFLNHQDFINYVFKDKKKNPVIIHYMGAEKPWKKDYAGKYLDLFCKYAKKAGVLEMVQYATESRRKFIINYFKRK